MNQTALTPEFLTRCSDAYRSDPARRMATLAFSRTDVKDASFCAGNSFAMTHTFSVEVPTMPVTDQQRSGRCWLFAATNVLREKIAKDLDLADFELSQSYLAFWDKFERCNYFLEAMIKTALLPIDDRTVAHLLKSGVHDGGQWQMFVNIVKKYGLVPKAVYNETQQSSNTRSMNSLINRALKSAAVRLRALAAKGASDPEIRAEKERTLGKIYSFLASCYTEPPKEFDFEYKDKNKVYHVDRGLTPQSFAEKYLGDFLGSFVSVINAPTADKPYGKTYTVRFLGNVIGGDEVKHLNLTMEEFKAAAVRQLQAGQIVWFGSDVGKFGEREKGVWDDASYDTALMTGLDLELTKAEGLDTLFSSMGHAMCLTGVDLADGKPTRWKIENSWGDKNGVKGYYVCSDSWFDLFVYQAALTREALGKTAALFDQAPQMLAPWDPMGTLAD